MKNLCDFGISLFQYKYANESNSDYTKTGKATLNFRLINQRSDFSFGLFSGGLSNVSSCAFSPTFSYDGFS